MQNSHEKGRKTDQTTPNTHQDMAHEQTFAQVLPECCSHCNPTTTTVMTAHDAIGITSIFSAVHYRKKQSCLINLNYFFLLLLNRKNKKTVLLYLKGELSGSDLSLTKRRDGEGKRGVEKNQWLYANKGYRSKIYAGCKYDPVVFLFFWHAAPAWFTLR